MKIIITTPLYPPEIGKIAVYVKELAKRLAQSHQVKVVMYGHIPEKVEGVDFVCVDKRKPLFVRVFMFFLALLKNIKEGDIIYSENGPSVELPLVLVNIFFKNKIVFHIGDEIAEKNKEKNTLFKQINKRIMNIVKKVERDMPISKPEILPFEPEPKDELEKYENSWAEHIKKLEEIFKNV